jgi:hypothetical protein
LPCFDPNRLIDFHEAFSRETYGVIGGRQVAQSENAVAARRRPGGSPVRRMQTDNHTSQARPVVHPDETPERARAGRRLARDTLLHGLCLSHPGGHRQEGCDLTDAPH